MTNISVDKEQIAAFCRRHHILRLGFFGSVLRNDFRPDSDVDILVEFLPGAKQGLFALVQMQEELQDILGREVDLVERTAIEQSRNYIRRKSILSSTEVVYAQG